MFKVMRRKMMGIHTVNYIRNGSADGHPKPPWWLLRLIRRIIDKAKLANQELETWAGLLSFKLNWWKDRG
jgi:hypothetical protein